MKVLFFILIIFSTTLSAQTATPKVWGYGAKSCTSYVETYKSWKDEKQDHIWEYFRYRDWLTGFVTALTLVTGTDMLHGVQPKNAMRRINLYCEENLGKDFFSATLEFIKLLGTDRSQNNSAN